MFCFLCRRQRTLVPYNGLNLINSSSQLGFVQNTGSIVRLLSSSSQVKKRPTNAKENEQKPSFTVSYFMNSCGLSSESAFSASKKVSIKNRENADLVLRLLSSHGFTNTQISKVVRVFPQIVLLHAERNLLPKFEFFHSKGVSRSDLSKLISSAPILLSRSLKNCLIPNYRSFKKVLVLDENVVKVLRRYPRNFLLDVESNLTPNVSLLREIGMPQSRISFMVIQCGAVAFCKPSNFCKIVNEVQKMGLNPLKMSFVYAIQVISMKKSVWESKIDVYGRWGLSKDEAFAAFRSHPRFLLISEDKITRVMDFLVNKMGWVAQDIAKRPETLIFSLEKRIVPRCSVVQVLLSKGLIRKGLSPFTWLGPSDKKFMERYIMAFQEKVPQLLNVYEGKMDVQKCEIWLQEEPMFVPEILYH